MPSELEDRLSRTQAALDDAEVALQEAQQPLAPGGGRTGGRGGSGGGAAETTAAAEAAQLVEALRSDLSLQQRASHSSELARLAAEAQVCCCAWLFICHAIPFPSVLLLF